MLNRKDLKEESKYFIEKSYWKNVLVALLLLFALSGGVLGSSSATSFFNNSYNNEEYEENQEYVSNFMNQLFIKNSDSSLDIAMTSVTSEMAYYAGDAYLNTFSMIFIFIVIFVLIFALIYLFITIVFETFILHPLEIGCRSYFVNAIQNNADLKLLSAGFDHNYMKNVKILFLRSLYIFLWSLLFFIPGIIKSFEYMMVPYIIKEYPEMEAKEVFALSREMMTGNKLFAWVLKLSFIGWEILSFCTFGILGVLYVNPYKYITEANFYTKLKKPIKEEFNEISDEMFAY